YAACARATVTSDAQIAYAVASGSAPSGAMRRASAGGLGSLSRIVRSGRVACSIARSAPASVTDEAAPVATRRAAEYRATKSYPAGSVDQVRNAMSHAAAARTAAAA